MTDLELINWCNKYNNSEKLAALLSTFTPDEQELNSWDIFEGPFGGFCINDTYYDIYSDEDIIENINSYKKDVENDYLFEVPESLHEYIDWKSYWNDNPLTIQMYVEGMDKTVFNGKNYYINYNECNN